MSENAAKQSTTTQNAATRQRSGTAGSAAAHGVPEPHLASLSPKVLARVPDLESADSGVEDQTPCAGREGRLLSSRLSMLILAVGGGILLAAALGLPLLLDGSESPDAPSEKQIPTWPLEPPAPSASVAPTWHGAPEQRPTWQLPAGTPAVPRSDLPAAPAWNDGPPSGNWGEPSPTRSWESPSSSRPWPSPPAAPWQEEPQAASPSPTSYDSYLPPNAYQRPQADTNRSMAIGDSLPPGTFGGSADGRRDPQGVDRTADARAGLPAPYGADASADYRRASPVPQTWRSGRPPANYPPTSYPGATYPVAGQSTASHPTVDTASTDRPIPGHPSPDPSYGATTAARYGMRPEARYREPGVARLQGGIEKPTESNVYDQHRSSIY